MDERGGWGVDVADGTRAWARHSLDTLVSLPGVRRAGLALLEGGGRRLSFTSGERAGEGASTWCHVDAYDDVPLNTAVRTGRAVVGTLSELEPSYPAFVARQRENGCRAVAAVPLVAGGHTLGGLVLFYSAAPSFGDGVTMGRLDALGAELGASLRRAQSANVPPEDEWSREATPGSLAVRFGVRRDPAAVGPARRELHDTLQAWGIDVDTTETAVLCLSELVTNAVVHGASGCSVHVVNDEGAITIAVRNAGAPHPLPSSASQDPLQVHGRGLQLVGGLASRWGSELDSVGMTVWFVLEG